MISFFPLFHHAIPSATPTWGFENKPVTSYTLSIGMPQEKGYGS